MPILYPQINKKGFLCFAAAFTGIVMKTIVGLMHECRKQLFSNFYLVGIISALEKIPKESCLLYIGYTPGDMQIGVTGSCQIGESPKQAAVREIKEELGVNILPVDLKECSFEKMKRGYCTVYSLCIDNCAFTQLRCSELKKSGYDNKQNKIAVIIYGSNEKVKKLIEIAKPTDSTEKISYYASVPQPCALNVTSIIKNTKPTKQKKI
ncbi:NUDIX hydrolase [Indivirus ILV1]|uniref:NUDIX hydrolase n=1 Tax=Indivirus ILV1 TaxID=1977633 RepID=A0A1V0SCV9_9VIRU|nr:NUDIX hydrolase [Indivirus ILV1]